MAISGLNPLPVQSYNPLYNPYTPGYGQRSTSVPTWYDTAISAIPYGRRESQRRLYKKGIKRRARNFGQYKQTMLPIQEAELSEEFASRGMHGSSLRQRSLKKLREPYRQREQSLADQYSMAKKGARKQRFWDVLSLIS